MYINPIASYNKNNNQTSFQAVNMKYLERAKKEIANRGGDITDDLLSCLSYDVFFKKISAEDGLDTIRAIKKLLGGKMDEGFQHVLSVLKKDAKMERQELRKQQKKGKKST